jgi:hypothetical protein
MGKIKPMRVVTPRIVQPGERSWLWLWMWLLVLVALAAWTWQVFEFGRQQAGFSVGQRDAMEAELMQRIEELAAERDALRSDAARFERAGQIDRAAADGVQAEVKALQNERAELKREVAFLKTLVSGEEHKLALGDYSLNKAGERVYQFEVTLSKSTENPATVEGDVVVSLMGQSGGEAKTLDMQALTDGRRSRIGIKFKNFQKLSAELTLPEDFTPSSLVIAVKPTSHGYRAFEQSFDWQASDG